MVFGAVGIELGDALYNTDIVRATDFANHVGGYSACLTDQVTVPLRITNSNSFSELYTFRADDSQVFFSSKQAALKSKQSGIITLTLPKSSFSAVNTTVTVTVASRVEAVSRSFGLVISYEDCFGYAVEIVTEEPSYCACEFVQIAGEIINEGDRADSYLVSFNADLLLSSLVADTIDLEPTESFPFFLEGSIPCTQKDDLFFAVEVTSGGSGVSEVLSREYEVQDFSSCYDTRIAAMDVLVDYSGTEVSIKVSNKGLRSASYMLTLEGIEWYVSSLDAFTLAAGQSKIITLYLRPDASVEEGEYVATLLLQSDVFDAERDITIVVKEKSRIAELVSFYASFLRYYWILVVVGLLLVWGVSSLFKRTSNESMTLEEKKVKRKWGVLVVGYFILAIAVLLGFIGVVVFYFVNRSGAETILPTPTSFVINLLVVGLIIVVILPLILRFRKKKKVEKKVAVKEVVVEKKVAKKVVKETPKKRKKFGDWILVVSVLIVIVVAIALFELLRAHTIPALNDFFLLYYSYMVAGVAILALLMFVLISEDRIRKSKKK